MPKLILACAELPRATALAKTPIRFDGTLAAIATRSAGPEVPGDRRPQGSDNPAGHRTTRGRKRSCAVAMPLPEYEKPSTSRDDWRTSAAGPAVPPRPGSSGRRRKGPAACRAAGDTRNGQGGAQPRSRRVACRQAAPGREDRTEPAVPLRKREKVQEVLRYPYQAKRPRKHRFRGRFGATCDQTPGHIPSPLAGRFPHRQHAEVSTSDSITCQACSR
jgi:hypothetical protein